MHPARRAHEFVRSLVPSLLLATVLALSGCGGDESGEADVDTSSLKPFTEFPTEVGTLRWQEQAATPDRGTYQATDGLGSVLALTFPGSLADAAEG